MAATFLKESCTFPRLDQNMPLTTLYGDHFCIRTAGPRHAPGDPVSIHIKKTAGRPAGRPAAGRPVAGRPTTGRLAAGRPVAGRQQLVDHRKALQILAN